MRVFCGGMVWIDMILSNRKLSHEACNRADVSETSSLSRSTARFGKISRKEESQTYCCCCISKKFTAHAQEVEAMTDQLSRILRRDALNGVMDVRETFKKCDVNGDGELDLVEFAMA